MTGEVSFKEACEESERTSKALAARVTTLEQQYTELQKRVAALCEVPAHPIAYAPFGSIAKLVEDIESLFDCRDGDHRAGHTEWNLAENAYEDYPYITLGLLASASIPDAQERLRQSMYTSFYKLKLTCKSARPVLYWRYAREMRVLEDERHRTYKIMTRVAIPEADFSVLGSMLKPDDGVYAQLTEESGGHSYRP